MNRFDPTAYGNDVVSALRIVNDGTVPTRPPPDPSVVGGAVDSLVSVTTDVLFIDPRLDVRVENDRMVTTVQLADGLDDTPTATAPHPWRIRKIENRVTFIAKGNSLIR